MFCVEIFQFDQADWQVKFFSITTAQQTNIDLKYIFIRTTTRISGQILGVRPGASVLRAQLPVKVLHSLTKMMSL